MKKLIILFFSMVLSATAFAANFEEGKHYVAVTGIASKGQDVTEYFSFYCPACFRQEDIMRDIAASLPQGVSFNKSHVSGLPGRDVNTEKALTSALVVAKQLGKYEEFIAKTFEQIHIKRNLLTNEGDIAELFASLGIEKEKYLSAVKSFAVNMQAKTMMKNNETLNRQGISGVPSIVVNGKYKAVTKEIKSIEEYKALVHYLLTLPV